MEKINLAWTIIWGFVFVTAIVAIFWNPAHFFTAIVAGIFTVMFWNDYKRSKGK